MMKTYNLLLLLVFTWCMFLIMQYAAEIDSALAIMPFSIWLSVFIMVWVGANIDGGNNEN